MRPTGVTKRRAEYVPAEYRERLNVLSKADLMEVAYSLAMQQVGDNWDEAFKVVTAEYRTLCEVMERKARRV